MDRQNRSLDLEHLARQTMGDEALQRQVLGLFLDHMAEKSPQLEDAGEDLAKLAHSIKGSAKGIGAWQVASSAEAVEKAPGDRRDEIAALKREIEQTLHDIAALLAS